MVTEGERLLGGVLHQAFAHRVAQLVVHGRTLEIGYRRARLASLERDHVTAGARQL